MGPSTHLRRSFVLRLDGESVLKIKEEKKKKERKEVSLRGLGLCQGLTLKWEDYLSLFER
jgi:hypothetical protein